MFLDIIKDWIGSPLTIVPKMSKRLIVNSQLEFVTMLHDAQSVPPDAPWEQEGRIVSKLAWAMVRNLLGIIEYGLAILHDLLFAR